MDNQIYKDLEKLNKIQKEIETDLNDKANEEEEVIQIIEDIISKLVVFDIARVTINNKNYTLKYSIKENGQTKKDEKGAIILGRNLILIAADDAKVKLLQKKYKPCYATVDYNYELSMKGNLIAAVEAWVRHITGTIKVESLEE